MQLQTLQIGNCPKDQRNVGHLLLPPNLSGGDQGTRGSHDTKEVGCAAADQWKHHPNKLNENMKTTQKWWEM